MKVSTSYLFAFGAVFLSAISQILLKKSAQRNYSSFLKEYLNVYVITGYGLFVISTILMVIGLQKLSIQDSAMIEALGYVLIMILGWQFLREKITVGKLVGNLIILAGILIYYS
ncbi:MAG: EamA family transporter [Lachnospiraceae bacterium]